MFLLEVIVVSRSWGFEASGLYLFTLKFLIVSSYELKYGSFTDERLLEFVPGALLVFELLVRGFIMFIGLRIYLSFTVALLGEGNSRWSSSLSKD